MKEATTTKRPRGSGSIFQNGSNTWWIKFSDRGIVHRESSGSTDYTVAEKLLKRRLAEVLTQSYVARTNARIDELIEDLFAEYREKQRKSIPSSEQRWRLHLKPFFTKRRACDVTTDLVRRYIQTRVDNPEPSTINRELAILKRAFNLALESTPPKVRIVPYIPMFEEKNVRTGFLKDEDYSKLAAECAKVGLWLRSMLAVAQNFGWRSGEIVGMRVRQIDIADRMISLEVGTTKNGHGRAVTMTQEVFTLISACVTGKKPDDHVFTRENGKSVKDFRDAWQGSCVRAELGHFICLDCENIVTETKCKCGSRRGRSYHGLLFHDLRRTGVRNLRRLGVAESVAMKISGHKTASVFRRYDIIEQADIAQAAALLDAKQKSNAETFGQSLGRNPEKSTTRDAVTDHRQIATVLPN